MPRRPDDDAVAEPRRRKRRSWARRRHLGLITFGAAVVILVAGLLAVVLTWDHGQPSFAQQVAAASPTGTATDVPTDTGTPATTTSATASGSAAAGSSSARGTITSIGDSRWTVKAANGLTYTIIVTADTTFPKKKTFATFAVGDTVTAKGALVNGVITATSVGAGGR